jgi:serine/threonine protein kinase
MSLDHPNIIKLHQVVYDNKFINIITEMVRGVTLTDLLSPGMPQNDDIVPVNEEFAKNIMYQSTVAL